METSLEHVHELEPHIKVARARAGVLMLILSDALAVLAILAAGGYLRALNTEGQYKVAGDFAPAYLPGLLIAIALVLSGLAYYWWERRASKPGETSQPLFFLLAWVTAVHLLLAAFVGLLLGGRILRGRVAGHEFIAEVVGYWWYYTVVASILLWLFGVYLT